ncbi:unnamed protein product [Rotaria sp. Silwood1]|nr:unnamed protein product [Rotaria sp. Silwood1]CAF1624161.1 unnamed protein product [Rotaria sp. Silwood1]
MLNTFFKHRSINPIIFTQRYLTVKSDVDLNVQMKLLNDRKQFRKSLDLFDKYKENNINKLSSSTITQALKACAQICDLERGSTIHRLISSRINNDFYILASLIHLYMQCSDVSRAESLFDRSNKKTKAMYGAMMKEIPKSFQSDLFLLTSLLDAFMKCGDVTSAQSLFNTSKTKSLEMYSAMMKGNYLYLNNYFILKICSEGYIKNNMAGKAIDIFNQIRNPNETITNLLFNACAELGTNDALNIVKKISKEMPKSFESNIFLRTSLLDAFMKCGDVITAQSLFDISKQKSLSMYGAMMKGYVKNNMSIKAIDIYNEIHVPNDITTIILFNACAQLGTNEALNLVKNVSKEMPKSFYSNVRLSVSLLDALMKCGDVTDAQELFNNSMKKSIEMYGAMMKGYIKNNMSEKAIELFNKIQTPDEVIVTLLFNACAQLETTEALNLVKKISKEIPKSFYWNPFVSTSLLDAFIKCGDLSSAEILFSKMKKSVIDYGSLMNGFIKDNNPEKVLNLFNQMKIDGIEANEMIYLYVIKALCQIADYSLSKSIIEKIPNSFLVNHQIQNSLIHMWGKIGYVDTAQVMFENISQPDQIGYTAMINAYGLNGLGIKAIELYHKMPVEYINEATYVSVLNACSHSGLIDEARSIFKNIQLKTVKIYTTMIDCLSRGSFLNEAQQLINEFECYHPPSPIMYMALLSGIRNVKNSVLSQKIYDHMKKIFPDITDPLTSAMVLLANTYASSGDIEMASKIKREMIKSGKKKKIGVSWTVINGQIFRFRAHDQSHPRASEIYAEGEKISNELIQHGHKYDSSWITRPLNQDETIASVLCGHSERLAIAFNFVVNPNTSLIQVAKNLRVCGDCRN